MVPFDFGSERGTDKAALICTEPPSPAVDIFEPILFPVSFQGPGALGSQWMTENFFSSESPAFFRDRIPCCGPIISSSLQMLNNTSPWGLVLYAIRGTSDSLHFASRIRDTSRQAQSAGTEVPVVRERDFRSGLTFMNVPVDARYRVTLRLWSIGDGPYGN